MPNIVLFFPFLFRNLVQMFYISTPFRSRYAGVRRETLLHGVSTIVPILILQRKINGARVNKQVKQENFVFMPSVYPRVEFSL